jgi:predicted TIM-barrel fold metal-dependent hydrolase
MLGTGDAGREIDRSIPFVDAHHHLWRLDRLRYPWLTEEGAQNTFLGPYKAIRVDWPSSRLAREFHGSNVSATVHVEGACLPEDAVAETAWLASESAASGFPNGLVVFCDLTDANAELTLEAHVEASDLTRGIRARPEEPGVASFRRALRRAAELGLSYELSRSPGGLLDGLELAVALPELQIVLAHAGFPRERDPAYQDLWRREMVALSGAPNVAVKISGLGMADHEWTIESIRPWVLGSIEAFGFERCMFGTNWPVDSLYSPYIEVVDAYRRILVDAGLSAAEQHALLHGNAERLYRL